MGSSGSCIIKFGRLPRCHQLFFNMGPRKDAAPRAPARSKAKASSKSKNSKLDEEIAAREKKDMVEGSGQGKRSAVLDTAVVTGVLASQEAAMDIKIECCTE